VAHSGPEGQTFTTPRNASSSLGAAAIPKVLSTDGTDPAGMHALVAAAVRVVTSRSTRNRVTNSDLTQLPNQLAEAIAEIEDSLQEAEARSHEARHLRNLRSALLPLAGRVAVGLAKAQKEHGAFEPSKLEALLASSSAAIEVLLADSELTEAQSRRLSDINERIREATTITRRLRPKKAS